VVSRTPYWGTGHAPRASGWAAWPDTTSPVRADGVRPFRAWWSRFGGGQGLGRCSTWGGGPRVPMRRATVPAPPAIRARSLAAGRGGIRGLICHRHLLSVTLSMPWLEVLREPCALTLPSQSALSTPTRQGWASAHRFQSPSISPSLAQRRHVHPTHPHAARTSRKGVCRCTHHRRVPAAARLTAASYAAAE
jgi:hypothetical protein